MMIEIKNTNTNEEVKTEEEVNEKDYLFEGGMLVVSAGAVFGGAIYGIGKFIGRHQVKRELRNYKKGFKDAEKLIRKYSISINI